MCASTNEAAFDPTFYEIFTPLPITLTPRSRAGAHTVVILFVGDIGMRLDAFDNVESFLDFLAELSLEEWLLLGDQSSDILADVLDAALASERLYVDAWLVCDSIETLSFLATCAVPQRCAVHHAMRRARATAERIALAILTRPWLATSDFDELVSPISSRWAARHPRRAA